LTLVYNEPQMDAGENWYGLLTLGTDPGNPGNIGQVPINVHRVADEVSKTASPSTAHIGDVVTYTIVIKNPDATPHNYVLTDVLPSDVTYVPGSLTGPATYNSGLNAVQVSTVVTGLVKSANYAIDNSLSNPNLISESPLGGFYSLTNFGGTPVAVADNGLYAFANAGCAFQFYDSANATPNGFQFATNGLVGPRRGMTTVPGITPAPIPTAANPNGFIAANWSNLSITKTLGFTTAGYLAYQIYNTALTCPTDFLWAFQFNRLHDKTNAARVMDVQYLYDFANPDVHWVQYGNVSGTWGAANGDVVGAENFSGSDGTAFTGPITSGLVLKYYRPLVAAPPITVTFQVTVGANAPLVVTNVAQYTVDVPNTTLMSSTASFSLPTAQLAVAHLAPFASTLAGTSVTVTLDGTPVLTNVKYGDSTGYLTVAPGPHLVGVLPGGSATPAITASVVLSENLSYSAIAIGDGVNQPLSLLGLLDDTTPVLGVAKVRIGHLAPFASGGAAADLRLQDGTPILTNVLFSQVSPYLTLPAGTYDFKITAPGGTPTLIDLLPVTVSSNSIQSVFATGDVINQPLGAFAWPSNLPGFFLPLATYGVTVVPPTAAQSQYVGKVVTYTLWITNTSNTIDAFTISSTGNLWTVGVPAAPIQLASGAGAQFNVTVSIPLTATNNLTDTATIKATSLSDPTKTASVVLTTTAKRYLINLPLILR